MLVRLLYVSRSAQPVSDAFIESILDQSRRHNPGLGITGVLCQSGEFFLQVLEGGRASVNQLYGEIVRDERHRDVMVLHYEEVRERRFASWTMAQVDLARVNPTTLLKYSEKPALDPYAIPGGVSMALLEELIVTAQVIGRAA